MSRDRVIQLIVRCRGASRWTTSSWERLPEKDIRLGAVPWFGESPRVFRLGFGYLPLPDFRTALDELADTLRDNAERVAPLRARRDKLPEVS